MARVPEVGCEVRRCGTASVGLVRCRRLLYSSDVLRSALPVGPGRLNQSRGGLYEILPEVLPVLPGLRVQRAVVDKGLGLRQGHAEPREQADALDERQALIVG